jgi:hypothetical protein
MIVAAHHHKTPPTPKCAVRAAPVTTTDKAHRSMMTRKDTNNKRTHLGITNKISMNQQHTNQTFKKIQKFKKISNLIDIKQHRRKKETQMER